MIVPSLHDLTTEMFIVSKWQLDMTTWPEFLVFKLCRKLNEKL